MTLSELLRFMLGVGVGVLIYGIVIAPILDWIFDQW